MFCLSGFEALALLLALPLLRWQVEPKSLAFNQQTPRLQMALPSTTPLSKALPSSGHQLIITVTRAVAAKREGVGRGR
ncbi:hypothetical protein CEXT_337091 [Caerostris extrusa]|uniref:Secreted protein n=1 Tax=Caerostris extrusa TaxID=172846 RepID=A0AAV4MT46_CAEEX|nr:hypothetical protein CEXT_337091 [Caerostris extrusa]